MKAVKGYHDICNPLVGMCACGGMGCSGRNTCEKAYIVPAALWRQYLRVVQAARVSTFGIYKTLNSHRTANELAKLDEMEARK